ncbi:MAG: hypothetical protein MUP45_03195 [Candidatus Marinimicrobia bacterium]|nr:hypothetical protein [Candidatus Neomarinimicrobiota bacterium]
MSRKYNTRESWLWSLSHQREEKEHKKIDEMIRKKDDKALGKWLKDFGRGGWKEILEKDKF